MTKLINFMTITLRLKERETLLLFFILVAAFAIRFFRLGLESFWLDELYVANEADPHLPLSNLFVMLKCCDQHPPLFYLAERCFFFFFGRSEATARMLPAAAGVVSVYAVYLLGKEIAGRSLGLVASALTCVNHFHILYSREARGYMFTFLFAALSLVYLFRLIKQLRARDAGYYALFALLTMYSHYFGVLLVFSQFCAAGVLFISRKDKTLYAKRFGLSAILILAGYSVWMPVLFSIMKIKSFWIPALPGNWLLVFFSNYFGGIPDLVHIMEALLVIFAIGVFARKNWKWPDVDRQSLRLSFVVLGTISLLGYSIPYVRGLMTTPMLLERYTIILLPGLFIALAWGVEMVPLAWLRYSALAVVLFLSVQREVSFFKTWSKQYKTQFRDVTAFMASDTATNHYPILNDRIGWFESYYLHRFDYPGRLLEAPRAAVIDSLVNGKSPEWKTNGFWLMNAHGAGDPATWLDTDSRRKVDSIFVKVKDQRFIDTWAQLYKRK